MSSSEPPGSTHAATLDLVGRAQGGDEAAVNELIERLSGRVYAMILAYMGPAVRRQHDAEDVLQEVWLAALSTLDSFDPSRGSSFGAWLGTIVRRQLGRLGAPAAARRAADGAASRLRISQALAASSQTTPSQSVHRKEAVTRLVEAVEALPAEQRTAAILYWFEERPAAEVAAALGKSRDAVYMMLMRTSQSLAGGLDGLGGAEPGPWR